MQPYLYGAGQRAEMPPTHSHLYCNESSVWFCCISIIKNYFKPRSIMYGKWPISGIVDPLLTVASIFLLDIVERFQKQQISVIRSQKVSFKLRVNYDITCIRSAIQDWWWCGFGAIRWNQSQCATSCHFLLRFSPEQQVGCKKKAARSWCSWAIWAPMKPWCHFKTLVRPPKNQKRRNRGELVWEGARW